MLKNIIIMTSFGGGGQTVIDEALHHALHTQYNVKSSYYFSDVIQSVDPISTITRGKVSGEQLYNVGVKKKLFKSLNILSRISHWYYAFFAPYLVKKTVAYLQQEKPDMVISIIPIVNHIIAQSCHELNIPFLIIPPDLDVNFFTANIQTPCNKECYLALPFDNPITRTMLENSGFADDHIIPIVYPLRADFYETKDIDALKRDFGIYDARPIILLMMGAQGSSASYNFARALAQLHVPAHLIICTGKNVSIRKKIEIIPFPAFITPHIIGYTSRISDLMAISYVLITKAGSLSITEALYSKIPILVDQTSSVLSWEYFNHILIETNGYGKLIKKTKLIAPMTNEMLTNHELYNEIKRNLSKIQTLDTGKTIQEVVAYILS